MSPTGTPDHVARPTGEQYELVNGAVRAVVTQIGGGLRMLTVEGTHVLDGFDADQPCDGARGQLLVPWPNRVEAGRYRWAGEEQQLPLNEVAKGNAIHGLTRWSPWSAVRRDADAVVLSHPLRAQTGWPHLLDCQVTYRLEGQGVRVTTTVTNVGSEDAPLALGAHPYLSAGGGVVDACRLTLRAPAVLPVGPTGIPTGERREVAGTPYDFREGAPIGPAEIDITYVDSERTAAGDIEVRLLRPDGRTAALRAGVGYDYVEVFTGDTLAPDRRRRGLGVEPMTAPPNALATGRSLLALSPDEVVERSYWVGLG